MPAKKKAKKKATKKAVKKVANARPKYLAFEASLSIYGGKSLMVDAEGEAYLRLALPASQAKKIMHRFNELMDRSFVVIIKL